ncbi:radical SAM protein [Kitasatospora sp. NPDC094015]|uniref:radical SAM protein n=1 Tax=Kitasatospora sp. NPDC094015 TaxID=3155205 RepID=UPI00332F3243
MRLDQVLTLRRTPGASVLLYLTDRCPVGCAHCSVSARPDSPGPQDLALLGELLDTLATRPGLRAVAVSGGEPFAERRALTLAVDRLHDARLAVVLFTAGHWAGARTPSWIDALLRKAATVFLGVDDYHLARLGRDRLRRAVRAVAGAGSHPVLQVIDRPGRLDLVRALLAEEFGDGWPDHAELYPTAPLATGRGAALFAPPAPRPATAFGPCLAAAAPTVRYDGTVTGCCNESVITGAGPAALRHRTGDAAGLTAALDGFARSPLLRVLATTGPGPLAALPGFGALAGAEHAGICEACWAAHRAVQADPRAAAVLELVAPGGEEVRRCRPSS